MRLNKDDLDLINFSLNGRRVFESIEEIKALPKEEIWSIVEDYLSFLIGYDAEKNDIDDLGRRADNVVAKLIILLTKRNEF